MRLEAIRIKDLSAFLKSEVFQEMPVLPISSRRGFAHAANPRALAEDVALLLAYLDDRMVGYLGFLPDTIHNGRQQQHLAWMSCIWVDPATRGKGVAKTLLKKGFELWDDQLLATEFTAPAKRLYDKMNLFNDLVSKQGIRCYLQFNLAQLLPASRPKLRPLQPLFQLGDFVLNAFNQLRLFFYAKKSAKEVEVSHLEKLDFESLAFIHKKNEQAFFQRGEIDLQWLLENPWLGQQPQDQTEAERYDFSVYATTFNFQLLKIKKSSQLVAVLILAQRNDTLKIPYCWLSEGFESLVVETISQYMLQQKLSILTTYQEHLIPFLKKMKTPFYLTRPFQRHYLISKKINQKYIPEQILIQDGDGDCAFT